MCGTDMVEAALARVAAWEGQSGQDQRPSSVKVVHLDETVEVHVSEALAGGMSRAEEVSDAQAGRVGCRSGFLRR